MELNLKVVRTRLLPEGVAELLVQDAAGRVQYLAAEWGKRCPCCDCMNAPDHLKCDDCAADFT